MGFGSGQLLVMYLYVCIEDISWLRGDSKFLFEC